MDTPIGGISSRWDSMRCSVIAMAILLAGCAVSKYETLDNCAVIHEQFLGYTYHRQLDCSDQENKTLKEKITGACR